MSKDNRILEELTSKEYEHGWSVNYEADEAEIGLNEGIIRWISAKKEEPKWLLDWRLKAFKIWLDMKEPTWANVHYPKIDLQALRYYSAPKQANKSKKLDDVDPELLDIYKRLGINLNEQKRLQGIAVDIVLDSVSVATTFKDTLSKLGIIFCSFSEAVKEHPELVQKYLGTVIPSNDNYYAALNSAVFSDGSFCYIPKGVRCPMELSTYFRINAANTGQLNLRG
jgi:Fe-S cluster assembly protein SufB